MAIRTLRYIAPHTASCVILCLVLSLCVFPHGVSATINIKKYEHVRDVIQQSGGLSEYATFEIPSAVLSSIDSLAEIAVVSKSDLTPLPLIFEQGGTKSQRTQVYSRETFINEGKIIHMVPAGSFPKGRLLELAFGENTQVTGTVSVFYTNANAGMDFSFWQIVAKDIPVASSANYQGIIRMQNTIDVDSLMSTAKLYGGEAGFTYDPQLMIVFKPGIQSAIPTSLALFSIPSGNNTSGLVYRYAYEEEHNDTTKTYIIDFNQAGVTHDGIELTVREREYASYAKLYTSTDKNTWTLRESDTIWGDPTTHPGTISEKNRISYAPTSDRYIKLELDTHIRIHPLVGINHAPIYVYVKLKNTPEITHMSSSTLPVYLTASERSTNTPSNLRMYYGIPNVYKTDNQSVSISKPGTVSVPNPIQLTIGPESVNAQFNDIFAAAGAVQTSGEKARELINIYGQLIASSIAAVGILILVLMIVRGKP